MFRSFRALRRATALVCLPFACAGLVACGGSDGGSGDLVDVGATDSPSASCADRGTCAAPGSSSASSGGSTASGTGGSGAGSSGASPGNPAPPASGADAGPTTPTTPVDTSLSDGQIFSILMAANTGEITEGKLARLKSPRSAVRDFADAMEDEHDAALKAEIDLAWKLHVVPLGNDVSHALEQETAETLVRLTPMDGDTFDVAYVEGQVKDHEDVLAVIDAKLLPSVDSPTLRAHIVDLRATVQAHLTRAVALRATLP